MNTKKATKKAVKTSKSTKSKTKSTKSKTKKATPKKPEIIAADKLLGDALKQAESIIAEPFAKKKSK